MSPSASAATADTPTTDGPEPSAAIHSCSAEYFSSAATLAMVFFLKFGVQEWGSAKLLLALVERQGDNLEGLGLAAQVHVQCGAQPGVLDVDVGQCYRVAQGGAGLAGGHLAHHVAVLEDRVATTARAPAEALQADELALGAGLLGCLECGPSHEVAFLGLERNDGAKAGVER